MFSVKLQCKKKYKKLDIYMTTFLTKPVTWYFQ